MGQRLKELLFAKTRVVLRERSIQGIQRPYNSLRYDTARRLGGHFYKFISYFETTDRCNWNKKMDLLFIFIFILWIYRYILMFVCFFIIQYLTCDFFTLLVFPVIVSLQKGIVTVLHLGERERASKLLSHVRFNE